MAVTGWLVDKSALARLGQSADSALWADRIERGLLAISTVTRLEVGYSARSGDELRRIAATVPIASFLVEHLTPSIEERSLEVQALLADRGQHRAPSIPDLLIAAIAEARHLTVLHVDKDFELIANVTGQAVEELRL